jgi:hypothetical protein
LEQTIPMSTTPERIREIVLMFAPIIIGAAFFIVGLLTRNLTYVGIGAGLLGVPGIQESLRGVRRDESKDISRSTSS